ncbi:MAG: hypothetical protein CMJ58_26560 [Planctomycetaceae bacterium]|nr:hypothetical protein [Planctomycetaceae bacterium]
MASDIQQIETIRSQTLAQLAELRAAPKPTYAIDGQSVSWTAYVESLQRTVDWCDAKLADGQPYEIRTQGTT